ncbi:dna-directed rna polymerase iii rpc9 [Cystoisospora suis]|uniref:DNA-directed RNA polymerase III subunit RPC9 n=1 Tax=Cystoisospora suis TaxID=483139 RepID=A0A2C6L3V5_9APIC|nr:dna-directed rna polymerase iii rpc9 [Cystoisospora suis]
MHVADPCLGVLTNLEVLALLRHQERRLPSLQALLLNTPSNSNTNASSQPKDPQLSSLGETSKAPTGPTTSASSPLTPSHYSSHTSFPSPGGSLRPENIKHYLHQHMLSYTVQEYIQSTCPYLPLLQEPSPSKGRSETLQKNSPDTTVSRHPSISEEGVQGGGGGERRDSYSNIPSHFFSSGAVGGGSQDPSSFSSSSSSCGGLQKILLGKRFLTCVGACMEVLSLRFGLYQGELLQIVNLGPTKPVEIYAIVEDCVNRFSEEDVNEILAVIQHYLVEYKTSPFPYSLSKRSSLLSSSSTHHALHDQEGGASSHSSEARQETVMQANEESKERSTKRPSVSSSGVEEKEEELADEEEEEVLVEEVEEEEEERRRTISRGKGTRRKERDVNDKSIAVPPTSSVASQVNAPDSSSPSRASRISQVSFGRSDLRKDHEENLHSSSSLQNPSRTAKEGVSSEREKDTKRGAGSRDKTRGERGDKKNERGDTAHSSERERNAEDSSIFSGVWDEDLGSPKVSPRVKETSNKKEKSKEKSSFEEDEEEEDSKLGVIEGDDLKASASRSPLGEGGNTRGRRGTSRGGAGRRRGSSGVSTAGGGGGRSSRKRKEGDIEV